MAWSKVSPTEVHLAKKWHVEDDESTATIAEHLGRDQPTITRLLLKRKVSKAQGRPPVLTAAVVDRMENRLSDMTLEADGKCEVTVATLKKSSRCKAIMRPILDKLHARWVYFRPLRQQPTLTDEDVVAKKEVRLRRTDLSLLADVVSAAVGDVKRRCSRLLAAGGRNIEGGGLA